MRILALTILAVLGLSGEVRAQQIILPCVQAGQSCIPVSAANPLPTTGNTVTSLTIGTTTLTSGTDTRVLFQDGASPAGVVQEDAGLTYAKTTGNLTSTLLTTTAGTLAANTSAFNLTATQPATPTGVQNGVNWTITSNGSASQINIGFLLSYAGGYTGSSATRGISITNSAAGTGNVPIPAAAVNNPTGNVGGAFTANTASSLNVGVSGAALNSTTNIAVLGLAQTNINSGTNIGVVGSAINGGSSPVMIGGWFSLNRTTIPATSAALIADIGAQSASIALWQAAGSTVASVTSTGALTATFASATGTNAVCNTPGTSTAVTVQIWATGCAASSARFKKDIYPISTEKALADVLAFVPVSYKYRPEEHFGDDLHVGFTAEQIGSIDSQWITYESDGITPHAVKYNEMAPLLTAAIQALKREFDDYKRSHP